MKKSLRLFFILTVFLSFYGNSNAQSLQLNEKDEAKLSLNTLPPLNNSTSSSSLRVIAVLFPFNPIVAIEDSKVYFGFTKEVTVGIIGYGNIAVEYSYLFRSEHNNHLRFSYNYDIILESGDLGGFLISAGGGYFTDFNKKGIFPQVSLNALLPIADDAAVMPYIKFRYTFMTDKTQSNIFDFSLGLKTAFYF